MRICISNPGINNKDQGKFVSYLFYAFSSIIFDVVAYTLSGKLGAFILAHETLLFFFPTLTIFWVEDYLNFYGYSYYAMSADGLLIVALPVVTFVAGLLLHKLSFRKRTKVAREDPY